MRGSPGADEGTICVTPLLPQGSGGRGQDCAVSAVLVSICPYLPGHNLLYSKVDASGRADDVCHQSSCSTDIHLFPGESTHSSHSPSNRPDLPAVPSGSYKAQEDTEYALV